MAENTYIKDDVVTGDNVIRCKEQSGIMKSLQDVKDGNVERFDTVDELIADLLLEGE